MPLSLRRKLPAILLAPTLTLPGLATACASCGCTLGTDAAMGYSATPGWTLGLEYSLIDQSQRRHGNGTATPQQVVDLPADPGQGGGEIERRTFNRYLTASLSYRPNARWGFDLLLPWVDRTHSSYGDQAQPFTASQTDPAGLSSASVSGPGDAKWVASYQGFLPTHNLGVQLGLKLPTGAYGGPRADGNGNAGRPVRFGNTGNAAGEALDSSLQAGTGSTDLIAGAYYYQAVSQDFDAFASGQYQAALVHALDQPGENFRPGNQLTLSAGLRYVASPALVPQLQINLLDKGADRGALADSLDSAGKVAWLSPGLSARLGGRLQVYAFAQLPLYSRLDGYQLFPRWTATAGLNYAF